MLERSDIAVFPSRHERAVVSALCMQFSDVRRLYPVND
jgi:hypothetical protein